MNTLTRPEGTEPRDLDMTRRGLTAMLAAGYAAFASGADAAAIMTPGEGLVQETATLGNGLPAFVARPAAKGRYGAVIVVNEIFGVHEYIRDICRRLATLGYVAIAPEFFHRANAGNILATTKDRAEMMKIVGAAKHEQVMGDVGATLDWLGKQGFVAAKRIGITGFCWGGTVTWMAAARFPQIKAGVAWYGRLGPPAPPKADAPPPATPPEARSYPFDIARSLKAPVLGLYGGLDKGIPVADVEAMRARLEGAGPIGGDLIIYPQAEHGFHADYRPSYNVAAATDGWARLQAWFKVHGVPAGRA